MTEATHADGGNGHGSDPLQKRIDEGPKGGAQTWYDVLEIAIDATAVDVNKAYDRALALVEGRNIGGYLMLDPLAAESARADVEAAFSVLGNEAHRAAYDARLREQGKAPSTPAAQAPATLPAQPALDDDSKDARELLAVADAQSPVPPTATSSGLKFLAPEAAPDAKPAKGAPIRFARADDRAEEAPSPSPAPEPAQEPPAARAEDFMSASATIPPDAPMPAPVVASSSGSGSTPLPAPALPTTPSGTPTGALPDGEIAGAIIRQLREARGLTIDELAEATKIRKPYLRAIEEQDYENLPARVYLRGFLTQVARVLKVDRQRLAEGYLQFVEKNGPK